MGSNPNKYQVHYEEFLSRGFSKKEADQMARDVLARDLPKDLSGDELKKALNAHIAKLELKGQGTVTPPTPEE